MSSWCRFSFPPTFQLAGSEAGAIRVALETLVVSRGTDGRIRLGPAVAYGRDDAMALTFGGFSIGMVEHDSAAASEAFVDHDIAEVDADA